MMQFSIFLIRLELKHKMFCDCHQVCKSGDTRHELFVCSQNPNRALHNTV